MNGVMMQKTMRRIPFVNRLFSSLSEVAEEVDLPLHPLHPGLVS
jgi:hypothetical protein